VPFLFLVEKPTNDPSSMTIQSLDPRITRAGIPTEDSRPLEPKEDLDQFETWEVFHQQKRGGHPEHAGSLHAPNAQLALVMAKEQYARRFKCVGIWVVRTADILTLSTEDEDIFVTNSEKKYRDAGGYRVGNRVSAFKQQQAQANAEGTP
jgi:ring-1,2-phenylacetyl-CoA epoxidase subunit PaaB